MKFLMMLLVSWLGVFNLAGAQLFDGPKEVAALTTAAQPSIGPKEAGAVTTATVGLPSSYPTTFSSTYSETVSGAGGDIFGGFATRFPDPSITSATSQIQSTSFITTIHTFTIITITDGGPDPPTDEITSISTRFVETVLTRCSTEPHTTNAADQMTVKDKVDCSVYSTLPTTDLTTTDLTSETASASTSSTTAIVANSTQATDTNGNVTSIRPTSTVTKFTTANEHHMSSSLVLNTFAQTTQSTSVSDGQQVFGQPASFGVMMSLAIVIAWAAGVF